MKRVYVCLGYFIKGENQKLRYQFGLAVLGFALEVPTPTYLVSHSCLPSSTLGIPGKLVSRWVSFEMYMS